MMMITIIIIIIIIINIIMIINIINITNIIINIIITIRICAIRCSNRGRAMFAFHAGWIASTFLFFELRNSSWLINASKHY